MALVFKTSCATFADLPTIGNIDGDLRRVADTLDAYRWDADSSTWVAYATVPAVEETDAIVLKGSVQPDVSVPPPSAIDASTITSGTLPSARLDSGTSAGQVVVLNGSAQLPAVSGALLTNLDGSNIASGTVPTARLDVGTGAGQLVALDGSAKLPAVDGSQLTNLPAGTPSGVVFAKEFSYDHANDGGAVGTISLSGGMTLPAHIVLLSVVAQPLTPFVGAGNVDLQIGGVSLLGGMQAATDVNLNGLYDYLGSTKKSSAVAVTVDLVIDTAPLTAGRYNFQITYQTYTP